MDSQANVVRLLPVVCNVEYAATKWIRGSTLLKYWQVGKPYSQDTSVTNHHKIQILWVQRKERVIAKKRQRAALTTKETRYNFRLLERDKRARRNQLQLLTNKPIQDSPLSQEATHG